MDGFGVATTATIKIKVYMYFLISLRLETIRLIKSTIVGVLINSPVKIIVEIIILIVS